MKAQAGGESIRYQLSCVRPCVFVRYDVVCIYLMTSMTGCPYDASLDSVCHRQHPCPAVAPEWTSIGYCPASVKTACQARRLAARYSARFFFGAYSKYCSRAHSCRGSIAPRKTLIGCVRCYAVSIVCSRSTRWSGEKIHAEGPSQESFK